MKEKGTKFLVILLIITIIVLAFITFFVRRNNSKVQHLVPVPVPKVDLAPKTTKPNTKTPDPAGNVSFVNRDSLKNQIPVNNISIQMGYTKINLPLQLGNSIYDVLLAGQNAGRISFTGKNYPGLGFFVTSIGNLREGNGKYLIYNVNGIQASSGVSSYFPKSGDVIEWHLGSSL